MLSGMAYHLARSRHTKPARNTARQTSGRLPGGKPDRLGHLCGAGQESSSVQKLARY
jgi:hypothetical protein